MEERTVIKALKAYKELTPANIKSMLHKHNMQDSEEIISTLQAVAGKIKLMILTFARNGKSGNVNEAINKGDTEINKWIKSLHDLKAFLNKGDLSSAVLSNKSGSFPLNADQHLNLINGFQEKLKDYLSAIPKPPSLSQIKGKGFLFLVIDECFDKIAFLKSHNINNEFLADFFESVFAPIFKGTDPAKNTQTIDKAIQKVRRDRTNPR